MKSRMKGRWNRKGQSILEYLVIVTVVVVAIMAIQGAVSGNMNSLFGAAAQQTATAAGNLGTLPLD